MILFLSINDWANIGYLLSESLKSINVEAKAITTGKNWFNYPRHARQVTSLNELKEELNNAEIVVFMHSAPQLLEIPFNFRNKRCAVFHGGTEYREKPEVINDLFNSIVDVSLIQTGSLLGLGAKNEYWLLPPIDTTSIKFTPDSISNYPIIAHFPRHPHIKGSLQINQTIKKLEHYHQFLYLYSILEVPWTENIKRMSRCDIYISALKSKLNGNPYGGGIELTDLESAALGNIVITHFGTIKRYREEYGECPLVIANSQEELFDQLDSILSMNNSEQQEKKQQIRQWVEEHHSFNVIGKRLIDILHAN